MRYEKHVFVCCNDKAPGKKCCGSERGLEIVAELREYVSQLPNKDKIRVQRSGCLDLCAQGPAIAVYPEGVFYGNVQKSDAKEIVESHLANNVLVERIKLNFD